MKIKLIKCLICDHWRMKRDNDHCPCCGAIKLHLGMNHVTHVNRDGKEMVRGTSHYHFKANALAIAQTIYNGKGN